MNTQAAAADFEPWDCRQFDHEVGHAFARDLLRAVFEELAFLRGPVVDLVAIVQLGWPHEGVIGAGKGNRTLMLRSSFLQSLLRLGGYVSKGI